MNRRTMILAGLSLASGTLSSRAETPAWRARFVTGGFDYGTFRADTFRAGLFVELTDGWKTYWRVPGSGGIPPSISLTGENLVSYKILYPIPQRFSDESGETIGYKHEVLFPIIMKVRPPKKPFVAMARAFLGVCQEICMPVRVDADIMVDHSPADSADLMLIESWIARLPEKSRVNLIKAAVANQDGNDVVLELRSAEALDDVFVDFPEGMVFDAGRPVAVSGGYKVKLAGVKDIGKLRGRNVRLTYLLKGKSFEQVTVIF